MLPDYDVYEMPDYETIAEELRAELFEKNNRLAHTESLLRKVSKELKEKHFKIYGALVALSNSIDTLLGE